MSPNPIFVFLSILKARRLRRPALAGTGVMTHDELRPVLDAVASGGVPALGQVVDDVTSYLKRLGDMDPDTLTRGEALAFWLNLYNAGALNAARRAWGAGEGSVLRLPGAFSESFIDIAGESLSLDGIEHGKIRRFGDPRIHGALVCGSASCPTLRAMPYSGASIEADLDDQMRSFLRAGGAAADREHGVLRLSRVLRWYGADFVRPHRMPTILPTAKSRLRKAVAPWLPDEMRAWVGSTAPKVRFMEYDWTLGCSVR